MHAFAAPTNLIYSNPTLSSSRRDSQAAPSRRDSSVAPTRISNLAHSSKNPKPRASSISSISKPLAIASLSAAATTLVIRLIPLPSPFSEGPGGRGGFGGGGFHGSGGGDGFGSGDGTGGGFWQRLLGLDPAFADEDQNQEWDSHGLPANIVVQLNKLSGLKKYKVSEILFFDRRRLATVGTEDSFFEMVSLRPGGVYTKLQLQKELENLATCGMFEKVDMEGKTNPDGSIGITISFMESTWQSADRFRCINVGLMAQSKPIEMDPDMTDKEKLEYYRSQEKDYKRRMERA